MIHTDPEKRHDFVLLFDVKNGNPNGDPDAGNLPRTNPETLHGLVSDVALKRKVRDFVVAAHGARIFIQSEVSLNQLIADAFHEEGFEPPSIEIEDDELIQWIEERQPEGFELVERRLTYVGESTKAPDIQRSLTEALTDADGSIRSKLTGRNGLASKLSKSASDIPAQERRQKSSDVRTRMCAEYYDIRMFGAVLQTGLNAGQVRGPMQLAFGESIDRVGAFDIPITRKARTTAQRMRTGGTEMARKGLVHYGLYRAHGFFNPFFGKQTGVRSSDLEWFWEALCNMLDFDRSAARGEMACRGVYVFSHDRPLGNAPAHKLFERIRIPEVGVPRNFSDYTVNIDKTDMPGGVTLTRLGE